MRRARAARLACSGRRLVELGMLHVPDGTPGHGIRLRIGDVWIEDVMRKKQLVLAVGLATVAVVVVLVYRTATPARQATLFLQALRNQNVAAAYQMTSAEFQAAVNPDQFEQLINRLQLRDSVSASWTPTTAGDRRSVCGTVQYSDGSEREVELLFNISNGLLINGIGGPRAVAVELIPSGSEVPELVGQTLSDLAGSDEQLACAGLHQRASSELRKRLTIDQLADRFGNLRDHSAVRQALQRGEFVASQRPQLDHRGEIALTGQRNTPLVRIDYRLRYRRENQSWKLSGIDVQAVCRAQLYAERFLKAIVAGEFATAYDQTSTRFRRGTVDEFQEYIESLQLGSQASIRWDPGFRVRQQTTAEPDAAYVVVSTGEMRNAEGPMKIRMRCVGAADDWKVDAFGDVYPGVSERNVMIRDSLLRLGRGIRSGDFTEFHRNASETFQKEHSIASLSDQFAPLVRRKIDFSSIAGRDPVANESPVMRGRFLEASGIFHTDQIELSYRAQYVLESADWKLDELDLEYNAGAVARTEQFLKGLRADDLANAHSQAAASFRAGVTLDELAEVVSHLGLDGFVSAEWQSMHVRNQQALLTGTVLVDDGGSFLMKVGLLREDGEWRVVNFNKSRGDLATPEEAVVRMLVSRSLRDLAQAIAEDDFRIVLAGASRLLKRRTSATAVRGGFKELSTSGIDLSPVSESMAHLDRVRVDNNGLLHVTGFYELAPSRIRFALNYDFEGDQWKLADINVRVVSAAELLASRFLHLVAAGEMDAAYAMTADALRQRESQTRLADRLSQIGLDRYDRVNWTTRRSSDQRLDLEGLVKLFDGIDFYIKMEIGRADDGWRVLSVHKSRGPLTVPEMGELTQLVIDTLLPLQKAIDGGDYEAWHAQASQWMQSLRTAAQLRDDLKPLTDRRLDLSAVADQPPTLVGPASLDPAGRLTVRMRCAAQPVPVLAELVYTYESAWKLLEIKLTFSDQRQP